MKAGRGRRRQVPQFPLLHCALLHSLKAQSSRVRAELVPWGKGADVALKVTSGCRMLPAAIDKAIQPHQGRTNSILDVCIV